MLLINIICHGDCLMLNCTSEIFSLVKVLKRWMMIGLMNKYLDLRSAVAPRCEWDPLSHALMWFTMCVYVRPCWNCRPYLSCEESIRVVCRHFRKGLFLCGLVHRNHLGLCSSPWSIIVNTGCYMCIDVLLSSNWIQYPHLGNQPNAVIE